MTVLRNYSPNLSSSGVEGGDAHSLLGNDAAEGCQECPRCGIQPLGF